MFITVYRNSLVYIWVAIIVNNIKIYLGYLNNSSTFVHNEKQKHMDKKGNKLWIEVFYDQEDTLEEWNRKNEDGRLTKKGHAYAAMKLYCKIKENDLRR